MALPCPICIHESRLAIEQAMINGRPKAEIARNFGFTYRSKKSNKDLGDHKVIARHEPHLKGAVAAAANEREVRSGMGLVNRLEQLEAHVTKVLTEAWKGEPVIVGDTALLNDDGTPRVTYDLRLVLAAVGQARRNVALLGELQGAIPDGKDEEMEQLRARLGTPEGRRLLAMIDALDAQQDAGVARAD